MIKISQLPAATVDNPIDSVAIVQSGVTKKADASLVASIARTAAEISAAGMPVNYTYEPGNVLRYGTNTTPGTTDMTAAVQAAIDVAALDGGSVFLPGGKYAFGTTLLFKSGVTPQGEGPGATELAYTGAAQSFASATPAARWTRCAVRGRIFTPSFMHSRPT